MKITNKPIIALTFGILLIGSVFGVEMLHKKSSTSDKKGGQIISRNLIKIGPNISDLNTQWQKGVKPFIERPFIPQEVEKLSDLKKKKIDETKMQNALILGPSERKAGLSEKPVLYNTVIGRHQTSISHPVPQPTNVATNRPTGAAFSTGAQQIQELQRLNPGAYSVPVKIQGGSIRDPTLSQYENPIFIHKGEKQVNGSSNIHSAPSTVGSPQMNMERTIKEDIQKFISQFDNAKDKQERTQILLEGKNRLTAEATQLSVQVQSELKELLLAKEVAIKINSLLRTYETKLKQDKLSSLKLADQITIKQLLKDKLHREMQGFRTSPSEFAELEKVNPNDIQRVIHDIKLKLGS